MVGFRHSGHRVRGGLRVHRGLSAYCLNPGFVAPLLLALGFTLLLTVSGAPEGVPPEQDAEIHTLLAEYEDCPSNSMGILQLARKLMAIFGILGWVRKQRLPNDVVGVDISNRRGMGVVTEGVYALGGDIKAVGWDDIECAGALCIEEEAGSNEILEFNEQIARASGSTGVFLPERGSNRILP